MPQAMDTTAEANRLYWETDMSVADIAAQLDVSRRALYSAIEPLPTNNSCAVCGSPLVFENRSARAAGEEMCPGYGSHEPVVAETDTAAVDATEPDEGLSDEARRAVLLGGAGLAGIALGAIATLLIVPRR